MHWLQYDGENYLHPELGTSNLPLHNLFANIKFWGDSTKGVYLKNANGMKKKEIITNKFRYDIKCPEKSFEKYLDDMGVLVIDFFDLRKNQTIGTSKIFVKLYIKRTQRVTSSLIISRTFPITLTGNDKVKIGEFSLSIISSFTDPFNTRGIQKEMNLEDSFIQNEKLAQQQAKKVQPKVQFDQAFSDDRIPSSLQNQRQDPSKYKADAFDFEIDQRPTRDRSAKPTTQPTLLGGKENKRNVINIDENEDTFHNQGDFDRLFNRGENLRKQMEQALTKEDAWESIHGRNEVPKKYVPPFLKQEEEEKQKQYNELDHLYELELEDEPTHDVQPKQKPQQNEVPTGNKEAQQAAQLRDMKYIRIKIKTLKVENEELNQKLMENFTLSLEIPLPDIYQKKITYQQLRLNSYDIVSFNEFAFNNLTLYNFRFDEETFNQLVTAQLKLTIEGQDTTGTLNMNKVLLANNYKIDVSIPMERKIMLENPQVDKKGTKGKPVKGQKGKQTQTKQKALNDFQPIMTKVGFITLEVQLQRGDTEEELARDYQMKLLRIQEKKDQDEQAKRSDTQRRLMYSMNQEPIVAQLYLNIDHIKHLSFEGLSSDDNQDVTLNQRMGTFAKDQPILSKEGEETKKNLYIQFKAFPSLEKLKTHTVFVDKEPKFGYRSQFPLIMSPETLDKLEKFIFILEVWDAISPTKEELIGIVKVPLASFCYSMKTTDSQVFSLNFLADQHCLYPMMVVDDYLNIYSPKLGQNVGLLKCTLALGSPIQINRQIQKEQVQEQELQKAELMRTVAEEMKKIKMAEEEERRRQEEERRRKAEEEARKKANEDLEREPTPERQEHSPMNTMMNFFKQSLNLQGSASRDLDLRKMTQLHCLRKLFEEARGNDIQELNGDDFFKDTIRNFDGSIKKDEFIEAILGKNEFTLTRTELSNICTLLLNINRNDNNNVDIDEIQFSYKSYLKYYELIETRIVDLLEKFKLAIAKKIENEEDYYGLIQSIEDKSAESKMSINDFRAILDNQGIVIRDALYDQFSSYFDLDRNDRVYMKSFTEYLKNPSMKQFNFFKVNPNVITGQIGEFVKNSVQTNQDCMAQLEEEFKVELHKAQGLSGQMEEIPANFLSAHQINAKLFQFKLKRQGVVLSLWEVFTLFEHLNQTYAKMYYEPQRYHNITFQLFEKYIAGTDPNEEKKLIDFIKASTESAFKLAQDLNKKKKKGIDSSDEGIYSQRQEESEEDEVVVSQIKRKTPQKSPQKQEPIPIIQHPSHKEMTFLDKDSILQHMEGNNTKQHIENDKPYKQLKHVFEIKVKELKNIPILDKLIRDSNQFSNATSINQKSHQRKKSLTKFDNSNKYIQNASVRYAFPLDEDEILESDYIQQNNQSMESNNQIDYKVSMNTVHTYILDKNEKIQKLLEHQSNEGDQAFTLSIGVYQDSQLNIVGNAQMPLEDLVDLVNNFDTRQDQEDFQTKQTVLFVFGTNFSQRENCIIGKMIVDITYQTQKIPLSAEEANSMISGEEKPNDPSQSCFMHRETYINRKIPLNAVLSVQVERILNLKESIQNIEHFSKIQESALRETENFKTYQSATGKSKNSQGMFQQSRDQADKKRVLTQIFKTGLNLCVSANIFEEDQELKKKFPLSSHHTRLLYNTLNPIFNSQQSMNFQMDSKIFDYLKNKKAVFEVRHYLLDTMVGGKQPGMNSEFQETQRSQNTQQTEDDMEIFEKCDYIVLGHVRVPLLSLITKNNGVEGSFQILDTYKQTMGLLSLRISLNHHNNQRPLYSTSNKIPTQVLAQHQDLHRTTLIDKTLAYHTSLMRGRPLEDDHYLLGISFVELILKNREKLFQSLSTINHGQTNLYLKFRILGQNFQSKFTSTFDQAPSAFLSSLNLRVYDIRKTTFVEIDFSRQSEIEEAFSKPIEVQLWMKQESLKKYQQPNEQLMGSFFIELNELSKLKNSRIREQNGIIQGYEGYFSLYDYQRQQVGLDRLGTKLFLIKKEYDTQLQDLEVLFHSLTPIENLIRLNLDKQQRGIADIDDLKQLVKEELQDPYSSILTDLLEHLEYRNQDKVHYSPLIGLPAPYFRYAKRFDQFGIIEKFHKELQALDNHDNGFTPLALFRSVLEDELKIKEKIVLDFISNMKENNGQTLDVNVVSHQFKQHIDYVVLLRKLCLYFELRQNKEASEGGMGFMSQRSMDEQYIEFRIDIESAMRLKNPINDLEPPNSFVILRTPFQNGNPKNIETPTVQKSSYPAWHLTQQVLKVPITEQNLKTVMQTPLEFEVYHQQLQGKDNISNYLIGISYIDISQMIFLENYNQVSGYFHIVKREKFKELQSLNQVEPIELTKNSLGQIKVNINCNQSLRRLMSQVPTGETMRREHSPFKEKTFGYATNPFTKPFDVSFNRDLQGSQQFEQPVLSYAQMSSTQMKFATSLQQSDLELVGHADDELKQKFSLKMSQLEDLTKKLKLQQSFGQVEVLDEDVSRKVSDPEFYNQDFAVTIGYNQSAMLQKEMQGFDLPQRDPLQTKYGAHPNDVVNEAEEGSELDREDNVFSNNMSEHSPAKSDQIRKEEEEYQTNSMQLRQRFIDQDPLDEELKSKEGDFIPQREESKNDGHYFEENISKQDSQRSEPKMRPQFDNEDFDKEEMERLNRILKSQKK